ncbi:MBOAT family protein [Fluoribacter dumoffii]|uniref:Probable alginate O-acetylase n=1 Tax=Fluoribacter dumoffii TaxID=463 RepID=A0A377G5P0_9GAMM|nr:MBOAT family O-acyltransferase [Fluoribacter dumoffii]KTC91659.1 alginate O-acetylation protein [Fluoribacter dumoffii NY 23]MCW8387216.1 MBOAT family protein [Fluoribacter dumoffii]MCW8417278.1 MBOAT family protein [Fluoribacter dumoffii]MCW8454881.1 MBOAT family protein [Fluoribacter dumoffii]MCW8461042.1 MBOAT family protein [Fluoribacter dumoffii]
MLFNDPVFIFLFLPIVFFLYFFLNHLRLPVLSKVWLVLSSLFFYGYWNFSYLFLIIISMTVNFSVSLLFQKERIGSRIKKSLLIGTILLNILALSYFKYVDFFIHNLNLIFNGHFSFLQPVLPLAISFYTFQQIAYLIDNYRDGVSEHSFLNYCLFVTFFPHLIAGPITHHKEMMPQFANFRNMFFNYNNVILGLFVFSIGLFKKVYIADSFALWANAGFNAPQALTFLDAWMASLSYTFQLYYDFSGYSDMAIGCGLLFNIRLPMNFNSPYKATNIQDFWRRWHMTLSRWLRDYIYIPLGGNRLGPSKTYLNLFITFLIGGIWHGANWTFIVWGAMHGAALLVHRLWQSFHFRLPTLAAWFCTFLFINSTWVVFRADNINSALQILRIMFGGAEINWTTNLLQDSWSSFAVALQQIDTFLSSPSILFHGLTFGLLTFLGINSMQLAGYTEFLYSFKFNRSAYFALFSALLIAVSIYCLLIVSGESEFLYFNF